jgi:citrate synthase
VTGRRLTTSEAAARLGVKPATLYAYVSRGVLCRTRTPSGSTFDAAEVEHLALGSRRAPDVGRDPLAFLTELTLIEGGRLYYRGLDAISLSRTRTFEETATWLWAGAWPSSPPQWEPPEETTRVAAEACAALDPRCTPADRWRVAVAAAATADRFRHDRSPAAVGAAAGGLLATLVELLPVVAPPVLLPEPGSGTLAARLWPRLSPLPASATGVAALDAALVLMADHEVAASTLAARAAASFGADPYAVVLSGMASSSGPLHAASSLEVRPVLARAEAHGPAVALGEVLDRVGAVHGFGHPLYTDGDPRATELLARVGELPTSRAAVDAVVGLAAQRGMPRPNIDFALAALAHVSLMVPGASEAVFVLGRTAGWIAHALEEYGQRTSFRVRATYVGARPDPVRKGGQS